MSYFKVTWTTWDEEASDDAPNDGFYYYDEVVGSLQDAERLAKQYSAEWSTADIYNDTPYYVEGIKVDNWTPIQSWENGKKLSTVYDPYADDE